MADDHGVEFLLHHQVADVLQSISDAVLVLDRQRSLRFANDRARSLLGYDEGDEIGGRCRLTTRGVDCETSCPLTFSLEAGHNGTRDFKTVYRTRDGRAVPLAVTVLPFFGDDGEFAGAVEILRPTEPDPGVLAVGRSEAAVALRRQIARAAAAEGPVVVVGEAAAVADVAAAVHRFSGLPEELFLSWSGSWQGINPWPAGSMLVHGEPGLSEIGNGGPPGWRILVGLADPPPAAGLGDVTVIQVPPLTELEADLPLIVRAQVEALRPAMSVAPAALTLLAEIARGRGFSALVDAVVAAVSVADGHLDREHLALDGGAMLVDDVLAQHNPLTALEERLLREVMARYEWRMQEAADRLGISRVTLWRKLKDHGIERPGNGNGG